MNILIAKLGATGDVVRTSTLLRELEGDITWITEEKNLSMIDGVVDGLRALSWEDRSTAADRDYDLVINLEDTLEVGAYCAELTASETFGAYLNGSDFLKYTDSSKRWFDLSLISVHGRERADQLKLENRRTYQDLIFEGMGMEFTGQEYVMPKPVETELSGDVAIAPKAGPVWPIKNWPHYGELQSRLEDAGLVVNVLPKRNTLLEHLGDVNQHRCVVGGDSLPMHLALGMKTPCVSLFTCTSPWEIYEYGILTKLISPMLDQVFYQREYDPMAAAAIDIEDVFKATMDMLALSES